MRIVIVMLLASLCWLIPGRAAGHPLLQIDTPMSPPAWALLQREVLGANAAACQEFFDRYFDERGFLLCLERWGGDDGPDDAIENCGQWPLLYVLGAPDRVLQLYRKAWEGHLRQFTQARTTKVPFARAGMYYKEFPVMFDWLHHAEGLVGFNHEGLADPTDLRFRQRVRRFAGFYLNEDPDAPNYDPKQRIIRSLFNGSRGPLLRKATALDWAGDPIENIHRFHLRHGERNYEEMLAHFKDYNDIIGDHPQNLAATTLAFNAYALTGEKKYRDWLLEYVDAWRERILQNQGIIPTNIGLDGKIGSSAGGKWYGGVYGWGFSVVVPPTGKLAHRNNHHLGFVGFSNAFTLTGDDRYLDGWRQMIDRINAQAKVVDGRTLYPHMYGDQGWYHFTPQKYQHGALEIWYLSQKPADLGRVPPHPWVAFLQGKNPQYPEQALRADLETIRRKVAGMRADTSTPDTRLSDNPLEFTPATVTALVHQQLGGLPPPRTGGPLQCRVRYFDPKKRRAGLPVDVAALVEEISATSTTVTLVNCNQLEDRLVLLQAGGYAEHAWTQVRADDRTMKVPGPWLTVRLAPGAGTRLELGTQRNVNPPTFTPPWE